MQVRKSNILAASLGITICVGVACTKPPVQTTFASPDAAANTLMTALKSSDMAALESMFGREVVQEVASGDPTSDRHDRELIALAMQQSWRWSPVNAESSELIIGDEQWPFPAPLVKTGSQWRFDGEAAKAEVLARRIGRNELRVIDFCHAYVGMQRAYASEAHDEKPAGLFAQRLRSSPSRHDGLYWPKAPGTKRSPLGDLAAQATTEGYNENKLPTTPLWGYFFRVLTAQGDAAPGGRKSYVENGNMSGGFGLVAFPAKYLSSGVMTFMINQNGVVHEKDLGPKTATLAARITEYNPDESWNEVGVH